MIATSSGVFRKFIDCKALNICNKKNGVLQMTRSILSFNLDEDKNHFTYLWRLCEIFVPIFPWFPHGYAHFP